LPSERAKGRARAIATSRANLLDHQVKPRGFVRKTFIVYLLLK
jgi:hypothetical protein